MKQIPLSQGKFAIVDDEDFEFISQWKWSLLRRGNLCHVRRIEYKKTGVPRKYNTARIYLHRAILGIEDKNIFVDHINGDGLDNRRENLRLCTKAQNGQNRGAAKNNKTGFKGVSKSGAKWTAQIKSDKKHFRIGVFDTPELAAIAYDNAARRLHGEFAKTNF